MDSTPVNWEALDSLVIDFAKAENLVEDSFPPPPPTTLSSSISSSSSSSSYHSRLIIRHIRRSLEVGNVDAAIDLLHLHAPLILDDHRFLFRLQKQKFIELLRKGTPEDRETAIGCLRAALAPCALDAYPEAYEEFKHVLLALIYDKDDGNSPVSYQWSEKRRFEMAGLLTTVLRVHLNAYDPLFSMSLRYLISIHEAYCLQQGVSSPISNLTRRLLLEDSDPPATPQDSLYEVPPFDEVDIQALAHAVELTRQGAIDSLRFAKGNLFQAFQNNLCRKKLDIPHLDELVLEYCVYRGIVDSAKKESDVFQLPQSASGRQSSSRSFKVDLPDAGFCASRDTSPVIDCNSSKPSYGETSFTNTQMNGSPETSVDVTIKGTVDVEVRYANEITSNYEVCSTSDSQGQEHMDLQRNGVDGNGERNKCKRWRGRHDGMGYLSDISLEEYSKQDHSLSTVVLNTFESKEQQDKCEVMLRPKELASRGMAAEVVEEVNSMDPIFFLQNSVLLFQLKQVEFLKLVSDRIPHDTPLPQETLIHNKSPKPRIFQVYSRRVSSGNHAAALRIASSHLGPLAADDPALLKPLKETLLALLRSKEDVSGKGLPLHALAASLQVAVGRKLGIDEPQLVKIMRATLHTHNEWFKLQMCKDRFEGLLQIDCLKEIDAPLLTGASISRSFADSCTHGSSQVTVSSSTRTSENGSSPTQVSSMDVLCDENAILKVMEFLALPRADAIHLLAQYDGNAETVIQQLFQ